MAWDASKPEDDMLLVNFPAACRANWDAIVLGTDSDLLITNAKISATAAIADTKLAQLTTASKVHGSAITGLASVPSGAGVLPDANSNGKLKADSSDTTPQYLDSLIDTNMFKISAGDLLQLADTITYTGTWSNLGTVSDVDINGGTLDGVQIGGVTATGELFINDGSDNTVGLGSQGTSGQMLVSQGPGANPTWATPSTHSFGNYVDKTSSYGAQQATTDGFVVVRISGVQETKYAAGYTDSGADPTTMWCKAGGSHTNEYNSFTMPVKKNNYWKVVNNGVTIDSVYWLPVGN